MLRFDALFEQPPSEFFETSAEAAHILGQALCFVLAGSLLRTSAAPSSIVMLPPLE